MRIESIEDLYKISKDKLEGQHGTININFANRSHVYSRNDVIGNCLQEWLPEWFKYVGVNIQPGMHSQAFPDFVAKFDDMLIDVEIKAWNINNAPAFDLANFSSFIDTTYEDPRKLNAAYFILGYKPSDDGFAQGFTVEKVYLKRLWEITAPSRLYPIGLQVKRGQAYAIRPYNFSRDELKRRCFQSKEEFIFAVAETFSLFPNEEILFSPTEWYEKVIFNS